MIKTLESFIILTIVIGGAHRHTQGKFASFENLEISLWNVYKTNWFGKWWKQKNQISSQTHTHNRGTTLKSQKNFLLHRQKIKLYKNEYKVIWIFLKLFLLPRATHLAMDVFLIFLLKVSKSVKQWWVLTMNSTVFYLIFIAIKRGLCHVPTRSCTWSRDETNQSRYWEGTRLWWLWFRQLIVLSDRIFLSSSPDEQTHTN